MPTKYFTGQELPIKLNPGIGVLGGTITNTKILYWKPDGTHGFFNGVIDGENISYTASTSDIVQVGTWRFQAQYDNSGNTQYGEYIYETFGTPLSP